MRFSPVFTLVLVTLASWTLYCHAAPVGSSSTPSSGLIEATSPEDGASYSIGETVLAQVDVLDDTNLDDDTKVKLTLQRAIPKPDVNVFLADVELSDLEDGYEFVLTKEHPGSSDKSNRYRIRFSFYDNKGTHHYVDSGVFKILQ
ncbi:unnamed protein product [Mortierella alpina]